MSGRLIVLATEHKEHLKFLTTVDPEVVDEFSRISIEFLRTGSNPKVYTSAAKKLGVDPSQVQNGVEGLMYLLTECSKLMISDMDFHDSILTLGFSKDLNQSLLTLYSENRDEIREIMSETSMALPMYRDCQWRIDAQLESRSLKQHVEPAVVLKIDVDDSEATSKLLQTDPANLLNLTRQLEQALKEVKSSHYRRITRSIR